MEKQKRDRKRREVKRRKEREAYLKNLSKDFSRAWKSVQKTVERGSGPAYEGITVDVYGDDEKLCYDWAFSVGKDYG